jgi:hypothetical protein
MLLQHIVLWKMLLHGSTMSNADLENERQERENQRLENVRQPNKFATETKLRNQKIVQENDVDNYRSLEFANGTLYIAGATVHARPNHTTMETVPTIRSAPGRPIPCF